MTNEEIIVLQANKIAELDKELKQFIEWWSRARREKELIEKDFQQLKEKINK